MRQTWQAVFGELLIVAIFSSDGFTEKTFPAVRGLVEAHHPAFTEYLAPSTFIVSFKPKSTQRAHALVASVQELRSRHTQFADLGTGTAARKLIFQRDWLRRIRCQPLGDAVNQAMRAATNDRAHIEPKET